KPHRQRLRGHSRQGRLRTHRQPSPHHVTARQKHHQKIAPTTRSHRRHQLRYQLADPRRRRPHRQQHQRHSRRRPSRRSRRRKNVLVVTHNTRRHPHHRRLHRTRTAPQPGKPRRHQIRIHDFRQHPASRRLRHRISQHHARNGLPLRTALS